MTHAPELLPLIRDAALFGLALFVLWLGCAMRSTKRRDRAAEDLAEQAARLGKSQARHGVG